MRCYFYCFYVFFFDYVLSQVRAITFGQHSLRRTPRVSVSLYTTLHHMYYVHTAFLLYTFFSILHTTVFFVCKRRHTSTFVCVCVRASVFICVRVCVRPNAYVDPFFIYYDYLSRPP